MATSGESGRDRAELVNSGYNHKMPSFVSRELQGRGYQMLPEITFISRGMGFCSSRLVEENLLDFNHGTFLNVSVSESEF